MKEPTQLAIAALLGFNFLTVQAQAKFVVDYDEFSDETTVSIVPEKVDPKRPRLSMSERFRGKKPTLMPAFFAFGFQIYHTRLFFGEQPKCAFRVRILADGKAVRNPPLPSPLFRETGASLINLGSNNRNLIGYFILQEFFDLPVFERIVRAKTVKYRLCDSNSEVFELTAHEKSDLKQFYRFFARK